jgi:AraC-like DNA-binding protein
VGADALEGMITSMLRYLQSVGVSRSELARITDVPEEKLTDPASQMSVAQLQHLWQLIQARMTASLRFSRQVRALIERQLARGRVRVGAISAEMNMSRHTLYKRLREENQTFAGLLEEVRREQALDYLQERHRSLVEVAELLGFSELSAFSRAFKRWMGISPAHYRAICMG